jgi:DNA-binding Xre family transcriptional regulator
MAIQWTFKIYLAKNHQIYTVTELQKIIVKKTGVVISVANLCKYVNGRPKMIRLETALVICSALECELSHFLLISPAKMNPDKKKKLSFKNTPKNKIAVSAFPSPSDYKNSTDK